MRRGVERIADGREQTTPSTSFFGTDPRRIVADVRRSDHRHRLPPGRRAGRRAERPEHSCKLGLGHLARGLVGVEQLDPALAVLGMRAEHLAHAGAETPGPRRRPARAGAERLPGRCRCRGSFQERCRREARPPPRLRARPPGRRCGGRIGQPLGITQRPVSRLVMSSTRTPFFERRQQSAPTCRCGGLPRPGSPRPAFLGGWLGHLGRRLPRVLNGKGFSRSAAGSPAARAPAGGPRPPRGRARTKSATSRQTRGAWRSLKSQCQPSG